MEIHKARKLRNGDKTEDAQRVEDHQKRMIKLQEEEEERKRIAKTERERVREELRKKGNGRAARNGIAPSTSKLAWLDSYNEQNVDFGSNFDFAQVLADAGIQQFAEPDPLSSSPIISTTFSNNNYCNSNRTPSAAATATFFVIHALPTQTNTSDFEAERCSCLYLCLLLPVRATAIQQAVQPGTFGWFDPENDGDENWEEQDEEFEFEDRPEIQANTYRYPIMFIELVAEGLFVLGTIEDLLL